MSTQLLSSYLYKYFKTKQKHSEKLQYFESNSNDLKLMNLCTSISNQMYHSAYRQ